MKNGTMLWISSLLLVALILIPCVQGASEETTLRIGTTNKVDSASLVGDHALSVFGHLSNPPLMGVDEDGSVVGLTAESYEVSEDGEMWKFYIGDNLYWSDSTKVTPEDVRFTIEYLAENDKSLGWLKEALVETSVADDGAVVIELGEPHMRLNREFTTHNILPKHVWGTIDDPEEYTNEGGYVGCGPFYIKEIDPTAGIVCFEKNPYWRGKEPSIDSVEVHIYNNRDTLSLDLMKGEVDAYYEYATTYPYANTKTLEDTGMFDFVEWEDVGLMILGMNLQREPISDLDFRRAVSYAIDYDEIARIIGLGYGNVPNRGLVSPSMMYFKDTEKLEYDVAKAGEILTDAGYADSDGNGLLEGLDGADMKLTLLVRSDKPDYLRTAELVEDYLEDLGIDVDRRVVERNTWVEIKDEGEYDMTITRTTSYGMSMWADWGTGYLDSRKTGMGVLHTVDDPEFHQLCDDIMATTDEDLLEEYGHGVQDYYAENLPAIGLYWRKIVVPYNNAWTGWSSDPVFGIYRLDTFLNVEEA